MSRFQEMVQVHGLAAERAHSGPFDQVFERRPPLGQVRFNLPLPSGGAYVRTSTLSNCAPIA